MISTIIFSILGAGIIILGLAVYFQSKQIKKLIWSEATWETKYMQAETQCIKLSSELEEEKKNVKKVVGHRKSSEVVTGQISERLAPLLTQFKYNIRNTVFIGMPIDYLVFEDDEIVFLEIKSGASVLSSKQKTIKKLVEDKKVRWEVIRISGETDSD